MYSYDVLLHDVFLTFLLHNHSDDTVLFKLRCRQKCVARFENYVQ